MYISFSYYFLLVLFSLGEKNASANNSNICSRANPNPDVGKSCSRKSIDPKLSQVPFLSSSIFFFNLKKKIPNWEHVGSQASIKKKIIINKNSKNIANGLGTPLLSETLLNYMLSLKDSAFDKIVSIKIPRISFHLL